MTPKQKLEFIAVCDERDRRAKRRKINTYYPDAGLLRRELYPKHTAFFKAGATHRQRLMLAANRVGKTESVGLYELSVHLTGVYPSWWEGKRFERPVKCWAAGDTGKTVREILQSKLLGPLSEMGTGMLLGDTIDRITRASGVADAVDTVYVRHISGELSTVTFKSYDQRRESFQGSEMDVILLDEEPPLDVYTECLVRTMTNGGIILLTFTPLMGMSEVVLSFLPNGEIVEQLEDASKYVITATWDDVPHLSDLVKSELLAAIPPFQRDARSKGVPQLGAGAIYPVPESDITVLDFPIPDHWPRVYGMDVGWNRTAVVWGAVDLDTQTTYLYSEHYRGQAEPIIHVESIKSRGEWIPGVIDPAARGRAQGDGVQLLAQYIGMGLDVMPANNSKEAGLYAVWQALSSGKLRVFKSLSNWLAEFRLYRRDEKGSVVKVNDHLMDATRYLKMSGIDRASTKPAENKRSYDNNSDGGWMG